MGSLERRAVPRLEYPAGKRPVFVTTSGEYDVVDCAERGLRFVAPAESPPIATELTGRVVFPSGAWGKVEGAVVRVGEGTVGFQFTGLWLSPELIEHERRWLRQLEQPTPTGAAD